MKRPLTIVALFYALGVVAANQLHFPLGFLFVLSFSLACAVVLADRARTFLFWTLLFLTGWTNLAWRTAVISPFDLRLLIEDRSELVAVKGVLLEMPNSRVHFRNDQTNWHSLAQ